MIREDHIDYKEFMKRKELKRAMQSKSKNPFAARILVDLLSSNADHQWGSV